MKHRASRRPLAWAIMLAVLSFQQQVQAQSQTPIPDSGSLSKQQDTLPQKIEKNDTVLLEDDSFDSPEESTFDGPTVVIKQVKLEGIKAISQELIQAALQQELNKEHDFASLERMAFYVTRQYREAGYLTAWAYLPEQELIDNTLIIRVLEGQLQEIEVVSEGRLRSRIAKSFVSRLKNSSSLNSQHLERQLRLLNDIPGVQAKATLSPGSVVGTSKIRVNTSDETLLSGNISIDNMGNRFTNATRAGAFLEVANPFGFGESIYSRIASSRKGYRFASLGLSLPVGGSGLIVNTDAQFTKYTLLKDFQALGAEGDNSRLNISLSYPWIRELDTNLKSSISLSQSDYEDRNDLLGAFSRKEVSEIKVQVSGDYLDLDSNLSTFSAAIAAGDVSDDFLSASQDAYGILGRYTVFNLAASYRSWLNDNWFVWLKGQGQYSQDNLNSSQKFALGGPQGVRAYPQGEALVDQGALLSAEFHYQLNEQWQFSVFADAAHGKRYSEALINDRNNLRSLSGAGLSAQWRPLDDVYINLISAWRTDSQPLSDQDKSPRLWLQFIWQL